ncbi:TPA: formylglycine-generating enzyme family protein [Candidatus Poribacteria bacterium]|nr:formylglycine-generating enzyme family protein [Candidatus Poribacteria bacterium]
MFRRGTVSAWMWRRSKRRCSGRGIDRQYICQTWYLVVDWLFGIAISVQPRITKRTERREKMNNSLLTTFTVFLPSAGGMGADSADHPPPAKAPFNAWQAKEFQGQWAKHIGKPVVHTNSIGMKMVFIPPGEFTMGRTEEQFDRLLNIIENDPDLKRNRGGVITWEMLMMPAHRVRITKPFYIGATEVTVGQFRQFCEATGYKTEAERGLHGGRPYKGSRPICTWRKPMVWLDLQQEDDEPVLHLCWNDCVAFCKWLGEKEGVEYALPTEAEWEYACRAGTTTACAPSDTNMYS